MVTQDHISLYRSECAAAFGRAYWSKNSDLNNLRVHRATQRQIADKVHALLPRDALVFPVKAWEPHTPQDPGLVSARFSALAKRRGFRVPLHQLRHTHASLLLRAGIPIPDVSARLGHSNPGVTMKTYAHAIPTEQGHTVAAIEKKLGG